MMQGIQFVTTAKGRRVAVMIDLHCSDYYSSDLS